MNKEDYLLVLESDIVKLGLAHQIIIKQTNYVKVKLTNDKFNRIKTLSNKLKQKK